MNRPPRRGNAPLEFVLVLPLLLLVASVGWWAAQAGFTRVRTATEARQKAWENRDRCDPGSAFDLRQNVLFSYLWERARNVVERRSPITGENLTAEAFAGLTDKTHDHTRFEFPKLPERIAPHVERLKHFGRFDPLIARFAPMTAGYAQMDPRADAKLARYESEGPDRTRRRTGAIRAIRRQESSMASAQTTLERIADALRAVGLSALAAKFDREAHIIQLGRLAAEWLEVNNALR